MLVESSGIFSNFGAESPPLLQATKRYGAVERRNYADKKQLENKHLFPQEVYKSEA